MDHPGDQLQEHLGLQQRRLQDPPPAVFIRQASAQQQVRLEQWEAYLRVVLWTR